MFGNIGNIAKLMKDAKENMGKIKAELNAIEVTGESGAGMIKITLKGSYEIEDIKIEDEVFRNYSKEDIQILIKAAFNDAVNALSDKKTQITKERASAMGVPSSLLDEFKM